MFSLKSVNDWIQTADLWNWKQSLNQLSHNYMFKVVMAQGVMLVTPTLEAERYTDLFSLKGHSGPD